MGHGFATQSSHPQASITFALTEFENKNRRKNVRVPSGSSFSPGEGDYGWSEMIFPSDSTFLLQGVAPGNTMIRFLPQREGKAVKRILYEGRDITETGIATTPGGEISDVVIVIGNAR